nr:hypothetical wtf8 protein - fission yeast (Schizosaccharomyces pombe) [Schizosaccharomyces pombe]
MKNNYTSLKSSLDEEDELKTDHEIDLEGPLPEYDSEEEGALPPYSDHALVNNPPNTHRENHSSGTADNSSTSPLKKAFLSFISIFVLNVPAVCYLTYKDALFKDYGKDEWVYFGVWYAICLMIFISLWCFYETWIKAVKVTVIFLAQCIKVTVISLAQCVKVIAVGLYNSKKDLVVTIWFAWVVICFILFGCVKDGRLNLNKALICSTCSISAALFFILLLVCIPIWTLCRALSGMLQVLGIHGIIALLVNGSMSLFGKYFGWRGYEIEGFVLFFFTKWVQRPGVLKRMRNTTGNVIGFILEGIGNASGRIGNAIRGANDNNDIPLGEMEVESEV